MPSQQARSTLQQIVYDKQLLGKALQLNFKGSRPVDPDTLAGSLDGNS